MPQTPNSASFQQELKAVCGYLLFSFFPIRYFRFDEAEQLTDIVSY